MKFVARFDWVLSVSRTLFILIVILTSVLGRNAWERPGCHLLGHTRAVSIPGCVRFSITTNACRGFCTSYAVPSSSSTLRQNPNHLVTSRAECCSITETHDVKVRVRCLDGDREMIFKSAKSCLCSVCR